MQVMGKTRPDLSCQTSTFLIQKNTKTIKFLAYIFCLFSMLYKYILENILSCILNLSKTMIVFVLFVNRLAGWARFYP